MDNITTRTWLDRLGIPAEPRPTRYVYAIEPEVENDTPDTADTPEVEA